MKPFEDEKMNLVGYFFDGEEVSIDEMDETILERLYDTHSLFLFIYDNEIYYLTYQLNLTGFGEFMVRNHVPNEDDYPVCSYDIGDYYDDVVDLLKGEKNVLEEIVDCIIDRYGSTINKYSQVIDNLKTFRSIYGNKLNWDSFIDTIGDCPDF